MTPLDAVAAAIRSRLMDSEPAPLPGLGTLSRQHVSARVEEKPDGTRVLLPPGETITLSETGPGHASLAPSFADIMELPADRAEAEYTRAMDQIEARLAATGEVRLPGVGLLRRTSGGILLGVEADLLAAVNRTYEGLSPVGTGASESPPAQPPKTSPDATPPAPAAPVAPATPPSPAEPADASGPSDESERMPRSPNPASDTSADTNEDAAPGAQQPVPSAPVSPRPVPYEPIAPGTAFSLMAGDESPPFSTASPADDSGLPTDVEPPSDSPADVVGVVPQADEPVDNARPDLPPVVSVPRDVTPEAELPRTATEPPQSPAPLPDSPGADVEPEASFAGTGVDDDALGEAFDDVMHVTPGVTSHEGIQPPSPIVAADTDWTAPMPSALAGSFTEASAPIEDADYSVVSSAVTPEEEMNQALATPAVVPVERVTPAMVAQPVEPPVTHEADEAPRRRWGLWLFVLVLLLALAAVATWFLVPQFRAFFDSSPTLVDSRQPVGASSAADGVLQPIAAATESLVDSALVGLDVEDGSAPAEPSSEDAEASADLPPPEARSAGPPSPSAIVPTESPRTEEAPRAPSREASSETPARAAAILPPVLANLDAAEASALSGREPVEAGASGWTLVVYSTASRDAAQSLSRRYAQAGYRSSVLTSGSGDRIRH
ncbi:MAG: hypothetical protein AAGK21_02195, partial [Bacteroidota bacterium]